MANLLYLLNQQLREVMSLGTESERKETTRYAKEKINLFLDSGEHSLAVLVSEIYLNIRLKSVLVDWIYRNKESNYDVWKTTTTLFDRVGFSVLVGDCKKLGILTNNEETKFNRLSHHRNVAAHQSKMWRNGLPQPEANEIEELCRFVIEFLERHDEMPKQVINPQC